MKTHLFLDILKGKVVFLGVGNILRSDDGFGPAIIERLRDSTESICIDAGTAPENYAGKIIKEKPDTILIFDAAHLDLAPGEFDVLEKHEIARSGFTTHDQSPSMFIEYLENETKADIYMLAVQPENVSFGEEMSGSVKKAIEEIASLIGEKNNA